MPLRKFIALLGIAGGCLLAGCKPVKAYQMQYVKDTSMQPNAQSVEKLESEADTYREGSSGGMGGKTGGGCGCN